MFIFQKQATIFVLLILTVLEMDGRKSSVEFWFYFWLELDKVYSVLCHRYIEEALLIFK